MRNGFLIVICLSVLLLPAAGCEFNSNATNNSSQGDNEYFEEPLSERSAMYSTALETSNRFVDFFTSGRLDEARALLDPRLQEIVSDQALQEIYEKIRGDFGEFVEYKPMQWGFSTFSNLENVVVSTKIVIHEKTATFYVFNFVDDGDHRQMLAFRITPKAAEESVSQGASTAYGLD